MWKRLTADPTLTLGYILGGVLGSVILGSISPERFFQHVVMLIVGLVLFFYLAKQESAVYRSFAPVAYISSILVLLATFIFVTVTRGTTSWLDLGFFRFQPSELSKPLLIISFAFLLEHFPPKNLRNILLNTIVFAIPTLLIYLQPDLGTALIVTVIWLTQIFVAGIPWRYIIVSTALLALLVPFIPRFLHDYQLARLTSFVDPFSDPLGSGYNVIQSMIAIGSGGITGKGLGEGTQSHLHFLPERHTDFVFASAAEELGLIGSLSIIIYLGILIYRHLDTLTRANTRFSRYVISGGLTYFAFQSLLNIGMNSGIAPVTGITLPLISYGGSSIIATAIILGISSSTIQGGQTTRLLEIR